MIWVYAGVVVTGASLLGLTIWGVRRLLWWSFETIRLAEEEVG